MNTNPQHPQHPQDPRQPQDPKDRRQPEGLQAGGDTNPETGGVYPSTWTWPGIRLGWQGPHVIHAGPQNVALVLGAIATFVPCEVRAATYKYQPSSAPTPSAHDEATDIGVSYLTHGGYHQALINVAWDQAVPQGSCGIDLGPSPCPVRAGQGRQGPSKTSRAGRPPCSVSASHSEASDV